MAKRSDGDSPPITADVEALARTLETLGRAIENAPNRKSALEAAGRLADLLREAADSAAELRARVLLHIQEEQNLTLAELGALIGVSRARAGQLIQVGRKSRAAGATPSQDR
jgi:hypothetical protein